MSVYFEEDSLRILVRGKTYPYRDLMRSLGGEYQAGDKTWSLPLNPSNLERISELCKSVGGGRSKDPPAARPESLLTRAEGLESAAGEAQASEPLPDGISISELMQKVQLLIAQGFPRSVWVLGEIQNFRAHASGVYFQLADFKEGASRSATLTVNATLWRSQLLDLERKLGAAEVKDILQDGQRVRLLVDVTLYKDRGQVSLQVQGLDPQFTKGSLAIAREKLLRELRAKGLDRRNKSLPMPAFPLRLGLISSAGSRAHSDFVDQLQLYRFPGGVIFFPAQMQGEKTLEEVVKGIQALSLAACDLIIITRGGGSAADLRWFDAAEIAYAIAACPVPIVAAIGHHEDVCIAEEICMQREKTPTAAADFIISLFQRTRERLDQWGLLLSQRLDERLRLQATSLQGLREKILLLSQRVLASYHQHRQQLESQLELQVQRRALQATGQLQKLSQALVQAAAMRVQAQLSRSQQLSQALMQAAALRVQAQLNRSQQLSQALAQAGTLRVQIQLNRSEQLASTLLYTSRQLLQREHQLLPQLQEKLRAATLQAFYQRQEQLSAIEKQLLQRDPKPWMTQGWTQLSSAKGRIVRSSELKVGMRLKARLPDALLDIKIENIQRKGED